LLVFVIQSKLLLRCPICSRFIVFEIFPEGFVVCDRRVERLSGCERAFQSSPLGGKFSVS
jgi:hypothetical protein